jgi:hypothetical protein
MIVCFGQYCNHDDSFYLTSILSVNLTNRKCINSLIIPLWECFCIEKLQSGIKHGAAGSLVVRVEGRQVA